MHRRSVRHALWLLIAAGLVVGCGKKKRASTEEAVSEQKSEETGEPGVKADSILIGTTCSFTGSAAAQGIEQYRGAMAYFLEVNAAGGVHGRKIEYLARDDGYTPAKAVENMKTLITQDKVFAIFGGNGSSSLKATTPVLLEHKATGIFGFGTANGAPFTREPPGFDVWYQAHASYKQEGEALVDALAAAGLKKIGIFYQDDDFGYAGLDGVKAALERRGMKLAVETKHPPKQGFEPSTAAQVDTLKKAGVDAVVSFTLYQPAAAFVRDARDAGLNVPIANSSIASDTWIRMLAAHEKKEKEKNPNKSYLDKPLLNVHSMPNWEDESIPVVAEFRSLMDKRNPQVPNEIRDPNYRTLPYQTISLIGFVNAKVFVEALRRTGPTLTRKTFRDAIEKMSDYDPGYSGLASMTFSPTRHQGTDKVFYVGVKNGKWISLPDPGSYLHGGTAPAGKGTPPPVAAKK